MKRPAIFFDRDNTLIANDGYLGDPDKVHLVPGAADAVARARSLGYLIVTVSNQSGVARGLFSEEDVRRVNARMDEMLLMSNRAAVIDRHEFCPFHPEAVVDAYRQDSPLRKPKPGMIFQAAEKLAIDLGKSWLIGDSPRDIEAGQAAGVRTILFTHPDLPASPATEQTSTARAECVVSSLAEAIDYIESQRHIRTDDDEPIEGAPADPPGVRLIGPSPSDANTSTMLKRLEHQLTQIHQEIRRRHEHRDTDFSIPRLLAGIVQVLALAALFFAYLYRAHPTTVTNILLLALVLQVMTASLLTMGRSR